jgi:hypothetical protein
VVFSYSHHSRFKFTAISGNRQKGKPMIITTWIKNADRVVGWDADRQTHYYLRGADVVCSDNTIRFVGKNYSGEAVTDQRVAYDE